MIKHIYKTALGNQSEKYQFNPVLVENKRVVSGTYFVNDHASFDVSQLIQN